MASTPHRRGNLLLIFCHISGWKREHVEVEHSTDKMEETLMGLKPDHRYAVYVETDTVADADIGVRSNISYTITMPYSQFMFLPLASLAIEFLLFIFSCMY